MNDSPRMSFRQRVRYLRGDVQCFSQVQRLAFKSSGERLAFDVLHYNETATVDFAHLVNRADIRMIERRCGLASRIKRLLAGESADQGGQELDSYLSIESGVFGQIDVAHPARAD